MSTTSLFKFALVAVTLCTVTSAAAAPKGKSARAKKAASSMKVASSAGGLEVDCSKNEKHAKCTRPAAGTAGSGVAIAGTAGFPSVNDGFIEGGKLVVAVELQAQKDDNGGIFTIDLGTGERTLVSGKYEDPAKGPVTVGTGPDLGYVSAVTRAGQSWIALTPAGFIRIDPKSGNRTLEPKPASCTGVKGHFEIAPSSIAGAPDGTYYVGVANGLQFAAGVMAYKNGSCSVVTMTGQKGFEAAGFEAKGAGPRIESLDTYVSLRLDGGKLWALHAMTNSIFSIDVATGDRTRVSSGEATSKVGGGDTKNGYRSLALQGTKVISTGAWGGGRDFVLTDTSKLTGQRTELQAKSGPVAYSDRPSAVYVHPTKPLLVLVLGQSVVLYDPATGNSNTLSS